MKFSAKTSGFEGLEDALIELEKFSGRTTTGKNAVLRGMKKAMKPVEDRAKAMAPVDDGDLRESIKTKKPRAKRARGSARFVRQSGIELLTGPTTLKGGSYGYFQEFGTVHSSPQPFMRPAADSQAPKVIEIVSEELAAAVMASLKRARKKAARGG